MQLVQSSVLQNCRKVEVGRDFWKSSGPTFLLKKGHLEQVAQDHVQVAFEDLQGGRLHNHSGQTVPVLCHSHSKEVLPEVQMTPPVFECVAIAFVLVLDTTKKRVVPSSLHPLFRYLGIYKH